MSALSILAASAMKTRERATSSWESAPFHTYFLHTPYSASFTFLMLYLTSAGTAENYCHYII